MTWTINCISNLFLYFDNLIIRICRRIILKSLYLLMFWIFLNPLMSLDLWCTLLLSPIHMHKDHRAAEIDRTQSSTPLLCSFIFALKILLHPKQRTIQKKNNEHTKSIVKIILNYKKIFNNLQSVWVYLKNWAL